MLDPDSLKKDWITLLVSTAGLLLTIVGAAVGVYHSAVSGRHWQLIVVDAAAVLAMSCYALSVVHGLRALGSLILVAQSRREGAQEHPVALPPRRRRGRGAAEARQRPSHDEIVRRRAIRAQDWFRRGVVMTVVTAAAAAAALNWIG